MSTVRAGLIQLRTPAEQTAAFAHAAPLVRQAAGEGAQIVMTPEGCNLLQRDRKAMMQVLKPLDEDAFVIGMRALARDIQTYILLGSVLVARPDGKAANRCVLIDREGEVVAAYDKVHMFDVDLPNGDRYRESSLYEPGAEATVAHTPFAEIGLTICYDIRFPYLHRALAKAGAQVITVPAAFTVPTGEAHWEVLLRARAIETGAFVLAPAQGGLHEDGRSTWGHTTAVDPWGRVIGRIDGDEPGVLVTDLDLHEVDRARGAIPSLKNERQFTGPAALA